MCKKCLIILKELNNDYDRHLSFYRYLFEQQSKHPTVLINDTETTWVSTCFDSCNLSASVSVTVTLSFPNALLLKHHLMIPNHSITIGTLQLNGECNVDKSTVIDSTTLEQNLILKLPEDF